MSLCTFAVPFSPKHKPIHLDKAQHSLNQVSVSQYQVRPFELRLKTAGKTENYEKKNGTAKFKTKSENESEAYIKPQSLAYDSLAKEKWLKWKSPLYHPNLSSDSNFFDGKKLEFEMFNFKEWRSLRTRQQSPLGKNSYFGTYFPEKNLFPNKNFLSKIFDENLKKAKIFIWLSHIQIYFVFQRKCYYLKKQFQKPLKKKKKKVLKLKKKSNMMN